MVRGNDRPQVHHTCHGVATSAQSPSVPARTSTPHPAAAGAGAWGQEAATGHPFRAAAKGARTGHLRDNLAVDVLGHSEINDVELPASVVDHDVLP